ncbi:hypothetical protein F0U61_15320 [Archangium violaceum]|uniref:hypothetical protein n=1 Tax=Archangium violaceum TaxID=83451 RepID=UPI002B28D518|nr:hypothetical protein F0U61_15320 [Archangium violaceum]
MLKGLILIVSAVLLAACGGTGDELSQVDEELLAQAENALCNTCGEGTHIQGYYCDTTCGQCTDTTRNAAICAPNTAEGYWRCGGTLSGGCPEGWHSTGMKCIHDCSTTGECARSCSTDGTCKYTANAIRCEPNTEGFWQCALNIGCKSSHSACKVLATNSNYPDCPPLSSVDSRNVIYCAVPGTTSCPTAP